MMRNLASHKKKSSTLGIYDFDKLFIEHLLDNCNAAGEQVLSAIEYHFRSVGSLKRAHLCFKIAKNLEINDKDSLLIAAAIESLHNASLIHDDIQDESVTRRNKPTLWLKLDQNQAMCIGDALISASFALIAQIESSKVHILIQKMNHRVLQSIKGQTADIQNKSIGSIENYMQIAFEKSVPLFLLSAELPCLYKNNFDHKFALKALKNFAISYQLFDDIQDQIIDKRKGDLNIVNMLSDNLCKQNKYSEQESTQLSIRKVHTEIEHLLFVSQFYLSFVDKTLSIPIFELIDYLQKDIKHKLHE